MRTTPLARSASVLLLGLWSPGCGAGDQCNAGETRACNGDNDCRGEQLCAGDPTRWLPCECDEPAERVPSSVGKPCDDDGDCASDEHCFEANETTFLGGAPALRVCTLRCDDDATRCEERDPQASCVITDDRGTTTRDDDRAHCLERCTIGEHSDAKCRDHALLACAPVNSFSEDAAIMRSPSAETGAACRPLCSKDADCGAAGACNRRLGVCGAELAEGRSFGAECDPDALAPQCEGVCVEVNEVAFCSHRCRFGSASCGTDDHATDETTTDGLCRFPEHNAGLIGDVGFCAVLCDTEDDCPHPELDCIPFDDVALEAILEHAGVCLP